MQQREIEWQTGTDAAVQQCQCKEDLASTRMNWSVAPGCNRRRKGRARSPELPDRTRQATQWKLPRQSINKAIGSACSKRAVISVTIVATATDKTAIA
jgi:hypothetical protein